MIGEAFAALSAVCYGFSGAAIAKGAKARPATAGTDNGVFLSVLVTTVFSAVLWAVLGTHETWPAQRAPIAMAIAAFVVAGLLATVLGRLANFRAIAAVGAIRASLFRRLIPVFSAFLAFFLLGERYSPMALGGMALVLCSVALTLKTPARSQAPNPAQALSQGLTFGVLCAVFYAGSYVARKFGIGFLPDAAFGTLVGALGGVAFYALAATLSSHYRQIIRSLWQSSGPWQWATAVSISMGQISLVFALAHTKVAHVAIISSLEIFVGIYFAAFVLGSEERPGAKILFAATLATIGMGIVAASK